MKRQLLILIILAALCPTATDCQVRFSTCFEGGALQSTSLCRNNIDTLAATTLTTLPDTLSNATTSPTPDTLATTLPPILDTLAAALPPLLDTVICTPRMVLLDTVIVCDQTNCDTLRFNIVPPFDPVDPSQPSSGRSRRWFYFMMSGIKDKTIALDIASNDSRRPVYSFDNQHFERFSPTEVPVLDSTITKHFDRDTVYIAFCMPYTYTHLMERTDSWSSNSNVTVSSAGLSTLGREMPLLTITDNEARGRKKSIYIHCRVHPCETPASILLDSFIDRLISDDPLSKQMLRNARFYILPMANPDGVSAGCSRTNTAGFNIEGNFDSPDSLTAVETTNIKRLIDSLQREQPFDIALNLHSQTTPKISYWVHTAASTSDWFLHRCKLFAALTASHTEWFDLSQTDISKLRFNIIEGLMWQRNGEQTVALTFETPYSFYHNDPDGEWVNNHNIAQSAEGLALAISDLLNLGGNQRIVIDNRQASPRTGRINDFDHLHFGRDYLLPSSRSVRYTVDNLPQGVYTIMEWQTHGSKAVRNTWQQTHTHIQMSDGPFTYNSKRPTTHDAIVIERVNK